jgi:hypothetical protein
MNNRPKPKFGQHYQILAVEHKNDSSHVGLGVTVWSWDASHHAAPWGVLAGELDTGYKVSGLVCAIKRKPVTCTCSAFPFPHKPGESCHAKR